MISKKKMVQFGAGNIGRSFIGQLFSRSGYEVVFIDINKELVKELNKKRAYKLVIKRNELPDEIILIENIRAIKSIKFGKDFEFSRSFCYYY